MRVNSIDTPSDSHNIHYVNPSTRGSPRMPKERRARSLTVSAVSLTFKVDTARRQRMLRTESSQDGRTKIARAQPRIRDGERTSSTLTAATSPSPTPSATRHCRRPICRKQRPDQHQKGRRQLHYLYVAYAPWIGQSAGPARGARRSLVGEPGAPAVPTPAAGRPSETGNRTPPGTARPEIQRKELAARPTPPARPLGQVRTGSFRVLRAPTP